jgi:hypothetical protein
MDKRGQGLSQDWLVFPAHARLILEERLMDHQADGTLDPNTDITGLTLRILALVEPLTPQGGNTPRHGCPK